MSRWFTNAILAALLTGAAGPVLAQQPQSAPPATPASQGSLVPLEVEIVLSRYQGDRKIASIPYTLTVNANGAPTQLNMGTQVPVPATTFTPNAQGGPNLNPLTSYNYRTVGTNIDLRAATAADARYALQLTVEDSSVYAQDARQGQVIPTVLNAPAFRTFKVTNSLLLKDGQSRQYTMATDRVTGEVLKVDVTLRVLK